MANAGQVRDELFELAGPVPHLIDATSSLMAG
jgi:hypothetical protein